MNSGPTSERIYNALRAWILDNAFAPGARLDPSILASELASSVTPVRDVLHLLAGQQLVEIRSGDGFHIPHVTGPGLADLYAFNAEVLLLSLRRRVPCGTDAASWADIDAADLPGRTAALFASIVAGSANGEHARIVRAINDRLHAVRAVEPLVLSGIVDEIATLAGVLDDAAVLRKAIASYHRRRRRLTFEIVAAFYRRDQPPTISI